MTRYRTGAHWGTTIVRVGDGPEDAFGRRVGDEMVAVVTNGDEALAERIVRGLHLLALSEALPPASCTCDGVFTDLRCPVHQGHPAAATQTFTVTKWTGEDQ